MAIIIKIVSALIFFAVGGAIYIAYRPTSLKMFTWFKRLGLSEIIKDFRESTHSLRLNDFMVYSLPDGLWVISYIMIVDVIWCNNRKAQLLWGGILTVIGVVSELLQRIYVVNGTYDYNDILCYTIPYILYLTLKLLFR